MSNNVIRDTLITLRAEFYLGIFQTLCWVAGWTLLLWTHWQIGLGVFLIWLATLLRLSERKR